ncbi:MAG: carbohydrate ABC transporter permease [Candidatus Hadarchaeum sp.]|uniref:carbohydrate ABC transporter permease n=1 Tax=Candidatus Hadarchaeum sp. TaxID=2883567 RepID=UPI00317B2668
MLLIALSWALFPILFVVISSFKEPKYIFAWPYSLLSFLTSINYHNLFTLHADFLQALANSFLIMLVATSFTLTISFLAGYTFSRYRTRTLGLIAFFAIAIRMLPPIIISIPFYPLFHRFRLFDKHITLAILYATFQISLTSWIMKAFIDTIPVELEEAAVVDGCTKVQVLTKIIFPLARPGLFTIAVLTIIFCWNEFLFAFLFSGPNSRTAPVFISELMGGWYGAEWGMVFAASTIQLLPILLFVWATSGVVRRGLALGAVK